MTAIPATFTSAWRGRVNWYDVRAYGATPSDVIPGLQAATLAAITAGSGVVYIPPLPNGTPWVVNSFANIVATGPAYVTLRGANTWLSLGSGVHSSAVFSLANMFAGGFEVEGLIFTGDPNVTRDSQFVFSIDTCFYLDVHDCRFLGIECLNGILTGGSISLARVRNNTFGACRSTASQSGTIAVAADNLHVHGNDHPDFGNMHGTNYSKTGSQAHVYVFGGTYEANIYDNFFDEQVQRTVWVDGTNGGKVLHAWIHDNQINSPNASSPNTAIVANTVGSLELARNRPNQGAISATVAIDLTSVDSFRLTDMPQSGNPTQIASRTGNGTFEIKSSPGWSVVTTGGGNAYPATDYQVDSVRQPWRVNHAGSPYTLLQSQTNLYADVSGGPITGNIPAANTMPDGWPMELRRTAGSFATNNLTLTPAAGTIMDPQNPGAAPGASCVIATNINGYRWRAGAAENVWELA